MWSIQGRQKYILAKEEDIFYRNISICFIVMCHQYRVDHCNLEIRIIKSLRSLSRAKINLRQRVKGCDRKTNFSAVTHMRLRVEKTVSLQ